MIKLDIISDVACPWCYVGKAYLDRALEARPDHPFEIEWHPYQLNPDMPPEGMGRQEYMAAKFGSRENILRVHEPLLAHGEKAGVSFDLPAIERAPNTLDAHRLIHWAGLEGRQTTMVSALFRAYWREGKDIGDRAELGDLAESAGLDRAVTLRLLESDADRADISARVQNCRAKGVSGVPAFVIAGRHVVQGAQPTEVWTGIIDDINAQLKERTA
ncbi:DsbA family oxidoreductase [Frigidibacter sp. SD6-1]|uniref:DsbA family oxidoreductase n=1 Tax=Frigidibacter sp. SD6-1 TaxID=3032581 RepID=UPI0024DF694C|nr:DsbA family oxidoreductase [Frigidibacter sp. SD6-1]